MDRSTPTPQGHRDKDQESDLEALYEKFRKLEQEHADMLDIFRAAKSVLWFIKFLGGLGMAVLSVAYMANTIWTNIHPGSK